MAIKQPADKSHFILPDLGEGVHEAELIRWRVTPGEDVQEHQILAEMETDKALVEVPSPWGGTVTKLNGNEGDILKVGSILVEYTGGGGGNAVAAETTTTRAEAGSNNSSETREDAGTVVGSVDATLQVSGAFTRRREETAVKERRGKAQATPAVRRIAREGGININDVPGTGRGGRVTARDVEAFLHGAPAAATATATMVPDSILMAPTPAVAISKDGVAKRIPFRGVRRTIAGALSHSIKTAVHFTVVDEADVTSLEAKRGEYAKVLGRRLSLLGFVMTACCQALRRHPELNANVDDENAEILLRSDIHFGCAVDTEHGLMVPVITNADRLSVVQLADAVTDVATACRNRTIERERLSGGTFTISNVGSYGGMFATPIINYPEVAIIAAGRAKERVLVRNGQFYAGWVLPLSLSCDHRVVDGAAGAGS